MGEYIKYKGKEIKLGTCESLYYTRLEQLRDARVQMEKMGGNLDISGYLNPKNGFRYRFPFPEEDNVKIGDFEEYDKGLTIQLQPEDYSIAEFDHYDIWHSCSVKGSYNVNIATPCPQSPGLDWTFTQQKDNSIKRIQTSSINWRIVSIKQVKQIDDEIWTVIGCPYCGALARLPYEDAVKLVNSILKGYIDQHNQTDSTKAYYTEVSKRIMAGYKIPVH